jgi:hypothetical protein
VVVRVGGEGVMGLRGKDSGAVDLGVLFIKRPPTHPQNFKFAGRRYTSLTVIGRLINCFPQPAPAHNLTRIGLLY